MSQKLFLWFHVSIGNILFAELYYRIFAKIKIGIIIHKSSDYLLNFWLLILCVYFLSFNLFALFEYKYAVKPIKIAGIKHAIVANAIRMNLDSAEIRVNGKVETFAGNRAAKSFCFSGGLDATLSTLVESSSKNTTPRETESLFILLFLALPMKRPLTVRIIESFLYVIHSYSLFSLFSLIIKTINYYKILRYYLNSEIRICVTRVEIRYASK